MPDVLAAPLIKTPSTAEPMPTRAELHARLAPYARADSFQGYKSFAIDLALYGLGLAGVLLVDALAGKIAGGVLAGLALVSLGSLSHEAAHRSMVRSRLGNKVIAVVSFTLILFNYRLWVYEHHVLHHGRTNVKLNNFLSPLTLAEYRGLSRFRRALYRAYHSQTGLGILLYYLLNRWPSVHFYPGAWLPRRFHASAWGYTALVAAYAAALLALLVLVPQARNASVATALVCGFVLPYTIWFMVFSMTAFLQHTNPQLRWYRDIGSMASPPESTAVHVGIPHWMNHLTHYVLEHSVHHVSAMIPHYRLKEAQSALAGVVGPRVITMRFTLANMRDVLRRCRLYDYDEHAWRDFNGELTAIPLDTSRPPARAAGSRSGDLLPDQANPGSPGVFFPPAGAASATQPPAAIRRERA
jgi:omega-6 fatty acid desaturase (delta-12 desaturase)